MACAPPSRFSWRRGALLRLSEVLCARGFRLGESVVSHDLRWGGVGGRLFPWGWARLAGDRLTQLAAIIYCQQTFVKLWAEMCGLASQVLVLNGVAKVHIEPGPRTTGKSPTRRSVPKSWPAKQLGKSSGKGKCRCLELLKLESAGSTRFSVSGPIRSFRPRVRTKVRPCFAVSRIPWTHVVLGILPYVARPSPPSEGQQTGSTRKQQR